MVRINDASLMEADQRGVFVPVSIYQDENRPMRPGTVKDAINNGWRIGYLARWTRI